MATTTIADRSVAVIDSPVPSRTSPVKEMSAVEKLKLTSILLGAGIASCAGSWWVFQNGGTLWGVILAAFGILCIAGAFSPKSLKAACPYCNASIGTITRKDRGEGQEVRCEKCSEYSIVNAGILKALDPSAISDNPKFESPVFRGGVWPACCVACGEPPVRFDDLSKTSLGAAGALLGSIQVMRGSVKGVPYCEKHHDNITLKVKSDKTMVMCWTSLRMMRRYLAVNRSRQRF